MTPATGAVRVEHWPTPWPCDAVVAFGRGDPPPTIRTADPRTELDAPADREWPK
jgi:hypothetical protein